MEIRVERFGAIVVIHLDGIFNIENLSRVEEVWLGEAKAGGTVMAVYCEKLESLDSSAIGFFVKFFKYSADRGISLVICDLNPLLQKLFITARLDRYFKLMTRRDFEARYVS